MKLYFTDISNPSPTIKYSAYNLTSGSWIAWKDSPNLICTITGQVVPFGYSSNVGLCGGDARARGEDGHG